MAEINRTEKATSSSSPQMRKTAQETKTDALEVFKHVPKLKEIKSQHSYTIIEKENAQDLSNLFKKAI